MRGACVTVVEGVCGACGVGVGCMGAARGTSIVWDDKRDAGKNWMMQNAKAKTSEKAKWSAGSQNRCTMVQNGLKLGHLIIHFSTSLEVSK